MPAPCHAGRVTTAERALRPAEDVPTDDEGDATGPRRSGLVWLGVAVQPAGVGLALVADGMFVDPYPLDTPRSGMVMLALALAGLVPVVVQGVRVGGLAAVTGRVFGWGFAQAAAGILATAMVRAVAGPEWAEVASFSATIGTLVLGLLVVAWVVGFAVTMLYAGLRLWWDSGRAPGAGVLAFGGCGAFLLSMVVLSGLRSSGGGSGRHDVFRIVEMLEWAFAVDGPTAIVLVVRLAGVGVVGGLLAMLVSLVQAVRENRSASRARESTKVSDGRP